MKGEDRISIKLLDEDGKIMASPKIPLDITVDEFIEAAIKHFKLPRKTNKGESIEYDIAINSDILDRSKTFKELGIKNGTCITLRKKILKERTSLYHPYYARRRNLLVVFVIFSFILGLFCGNLLSAGEITTHVVSVTTTETITVYVTETESLKETITQTMTKSATIMRTVTFYTSTNSLSEQEITYSQTMIKLLKYADDIRKDIVRCSFEYLVGLTAPGETVERLETNYEKITELEESLPSPPPNFKEIHDRTLKGIRFLKEATLNCIDFIQRKDSLTMTQYALELMNYDLFISILEDLWRNF